MKLLSVGKSLMNPPDESPYTLMEDNFLARMSAPKKTGDRTLPARSPSPLAGRRNREEVLDLAERTIAAVKGKADPETPERPAEPRRRKSSWLRWLNPFRWGSKPAEASVQPEFSLDQVRVVRNDLSDADLEVISSKKPKAQAKPAAVQPELPALSEEPAAVWKEASNPLVAGAEKQS